MKILVTSSTGLTGKAVVAALSSKGIEVRAMLHSALRADEMLRIGASEIIVGDISSYKDLMSSMQGMDAIYYICPTAREDEGEIGKLAIIAAQETGIKRFIYQSVLHSIEPELPHHKQKLKVERELVDSGLKYSIVQPAPFMQNILNSKDTLINNKIFIQKFFKDKDSSNRINLIDARDFGQCIGEIALDSEYEYSTLELCGPENLSVTEMLYAFEKTMGYEVGLKYISDKELVKSLSERGASEYYIDTLLKMFKHYNSGDFCGSSFIVSAILKKEPTTLIEFLNRELK